MMCYLCKNKIKPEIFLKKDGYYLFRCPYCRLIWYNFQNDYEQFVQKQYAKGYFTGDEKLNAYYDYGKDKKNINRNMNYYLNKLKKYKQNGKILDVGCAYGYFMEVAQKAGFEVYGIDPSGYAVKQAKDLFRDSVQKATLEKARFPGQRFDVITMFDVFEHLQDPASDLQKVRKMLKENGMLLIATGDTDSLWAKLSGRKWTFYNPPQHIFYFNKNNITDLLEQEGFNVVKIEKKGKWLSLRYILHLASTVGKSRLAKKLYPYIKNSSVGKIPLYIQLNDNMLIFAKKK